MSLYDSYVNKLGAKLSTQQMLEKDLGDAKIDANLTTARLGKSSEASNARSAFAAGKASGQKKTFKGSSSGAYGAIGRLDSANLAAAGTAQKNANALDTLSARSNQARQLASTSNMSGILKNFASMRENTAQPTLTRLW